MLNFGKIKHKNAQIRQKESKMKNSPARLRIDDLEQMFTSIGDNCIRDITLPGLGIDSEKFENGLIKILEREFYPMHNKGGNAIISHDAAEKLIELCGLEDKTRDGRFTVRIGRHLKVEYGIKLTDSVRSEIGNLYNDSKESEKSYRYDITNDFSWDDGDFGKSGSCWWGQNGTSYIDSRDSLYSSGGFGLRIYDEHNNGIGRVWLYPVSGRVYLFNAYGIDLKDASRIILRVYADYCSEVCKFRKANIDSPSYFYVNNGKGTVVYKDSDNRDSFDIDLDDTLRQTDDVFSREDVFEYYCNSCGDGIDEDNVYCANDDVYCEHCYNNNFSSCDKCGESYNNDYVHEVCGHPRYYYLCDDCMRDVGACECEHCNNFVIDYIVTEDSEVVRCEDCQRDIFYCEDCNSYFENSDKCPDCESENESENESQAESIAV